jgi:hypothetical protein
VSRLSRQCGILNISQPYRPPRPVTGIALLYFTLQIPGDKVLRKLSGPNKVKQLIQEITWALRDISSFIHMSLCCKNTGMKIASDEGRMDESHWWQSFDWQTNRKLRRSKNNTKQLILWPCGIMYPDVCQCFNRNWCFSLLERSW